MVGRSVKPYIYSNTDNSIDAVPLNTKKPPSGGFCVAAAGCLTIIHIKSEFYRTFKRLLVSLFSRMSVLLAL